MDATPEMIRTPREPVKPEAVSPAMFAHFVVRNKSRNWLRHMVVPGIGFAVIAYVLWNAEANAKIAGASWLAAGPAK